MTCPKCGGHDIRRSYSRTVVDTLMLALRKRPYRCRFCSCRFYRPFTENGDATDVQPVADKPA